MMVPTGTSATGLVFTVLLPGITQTYWALGIVAGDGHLVSPLALLCAMWLALLAIRIRRRSYSSAGVHPHALTHRVEMKPLPKLRRP
ncbi:hypothetical protein [Bradyrhizobium sp. McL0615]|uniref:hypothetical protein n=1 Tax=Bradyrhizobium sp. McL0615 TaxID=3415673 RepID=UPI003CFA1843